MHIDINVVVIYCLRLPVAYPESRVTIQLHLYYNKLSKYEF